MNTDRMSAWLDDELGKTEFDALVSDMVSEEQRAQYFAYGTVRAVIQGSHDSGDYVDHSAAISRLFARLDEEPPVKKTVLDQFRQAINVEVLSYSLRRNWAPLAAAAAVVSVVLLYPAQRPQGTEAILIQERQAGSVIQASATEADIMTNGHIDGYLNAHEGVAAVAVPHGGGLASLRTIVHSNDLTQ